MIVFFVIYLRQLKDKHQMITNKLEQQINKELNTRISEEARKISGISNGALINYQKDTAQGEAMMYINALINEKGLNYEAVFIPIGEQTEPSVKRMPFKNTGNLSELTMESGKNVQKIQIIIIPSPMSSNILAVKISVIKKNNLNNQDSIGIIALDQSSNIFHESFKDLEFSKLNCQDKAINDFKWHPKSLLTLQILGHQHFQVWNLLQQDYYNSTQSIKLKFLRNTFDLPNQIKFTSFCNPSSYGKIGKKKKEDEEDGGIIFHQYILFLLSNIGEVYSIFPYYPSGATITTKQIQKIQAFALAQRFEDLRKLKIFFRDSEKTLDQNQSQSDDDDELRQQKYTIQKAQNFAFKEEKQLTTITRWERQDQHFKNIEQTGKSIEIRRKYVNDIKQANLIVIPVSESCALFFTSRYYKKTNESKICLQMSSIESYTTKKLQIHSITEIISDLPGPCHFLPNLQTLTNQAHHLYISQGNNLYQINFSSSIKFIQHNDLQYLEKQNPFPLQLIFKAHRKQNIISSLLNFKEGVLYITRATEKEIKFEGICVNILGYLEQSQEIRKYSALLARRLTILKNQLNSKENKIQEQDKNQNQSLKLGEQQVSKYQREGLDSFKKDYETHCQNLRNIVDQRMSQLKQTHEEMKGKYAQFKDLKKKKQKLEKLLQTVAQNNSKIEKTLFKTRDQQSNYLRSSELIEFSQKSLRLYNIFTKATSFTIDVDNESKKCMLQQTENMLARLKETRKQLQETKSWRKK